MRLDGFHTWRGATRARTLLTCLAVFVLQVLFAAPADAKRIALVIGNGHYDKLDVLANPKRDASTMADRLRDLGFEVMEAFDADAFAMQRTADRFVAQAKGAELALFYYAGHGIQLFDRNFLLARDVDANAITRSEELGLDLSRFLDQLRHAAPVRQALLIDACRENPFNLDQTVALLRKFEASGQAGASNGAQTAAELTRRVSRGGLASVAVPTNSGAGTGAETTVFFAAQPGAVVDDGIGQNSFFAEGLKENLANPERPLLEIFRKVAAYVRTVTKGQQVPQIVSDWTQDVVLGSREAARIDYHITPARDGQTLTADERQLLIRSVSGFNRFQGDFIARAGVGETADYNLTDADKSRAKALGSVNGMSITYDLDRDGHEVKIDVYFRQVNYTIVVEKDGVRAETEACFVPASEEVKNIEIALRDINGDRRPEVWIAYDTETNNWGTFCVLEYRGVPDLAARRRGNTGQTYAAEPVFRTMLRGNAGWTVTVATDNSIKVCAGSNCHSPASYALQDGRFTVLFNEIDGSGPIKVPFRDEVERARFNFEARQRATASLRLGAFKAAAPAQRYNPGDVDVIAPVLPGLSLAYECRNWGDRAGESIVVRQQAGPTGGDSVTIDPALAYPESLPSAPMLLDRTACPLAAIAEEKGGAFRLEFDPGTAARCVPLFARASVVTLPLAVRSGLLQFDVRSAGNAQMISQAQTACRAGVAMAGQVANATPPPNPNAVARDKPAASANPNAIAAFASAYLASGGGSPGEAGIARLYPATVIYYGKTRSRKEVVADKIRYYARWPKRAYQFDAASLRSAPRPGSPDLTDVTFEYDFQVASGADTRSGRGNTRLTLQANGPGFLITTENGEVLKGR